IDTFREALSRAKVAIQLGTVVHRIGWTKGKVEVRAVNKSAQVVFTGGRVLVTLPLGVLRVPATSGGVAFSPELPGSKNSAIGKLAMGKVVRVILRFEKRFWDEIRPDPKASKTLAEMRFLFSRQRCFPTWWTSLPDKHPVIVGWATGRSAEELAGQS